MKTILLAEDNRGMAMLCKRELEEDGYQVLVTYDGDEACKAIPSRVPDVVILDISMPGGNGLEALARIKAVYADMPVILFTGFDDDCIDDRRARLATACIEKSADLAELKRAIIRALACSPPSGTFGLGLQGRLGLSGER